MVGAVFCLLWCGRANDVRYSAAGSVEARKAPAVHPWLVDRCTSSLSPETLISWSETSSQCRQWIDWQECGHVTPTQLCLVCAWTAGLEFAVLAFENVPVRAR